MIVERRVSRITLIILACVAYTLFHFLDTSIQYNPWYQEKIEAARLMQEATKLIRKEAIARGVEIDIRFDPNQTGLIGPQESLIVTDRGILDAKLMTTNPNFAAVVVDMLKQAGVKRGDRVAVAYTGSMPGANLAVLAACEALGARVIPITSVGASSWGATDPRFTWLDMEKFLIEKGIFSYGSIAASMGGRSDIASNLDVDGRAAIRDAIKRNNVKLIKENTVEDSIATRIALYNAKAGTKPIKAFINVGGSIVSLGARSNGALISPGLNLTLDVSRFYSRGLMVHMAERNIPVIHLLKIREIVRDYGLSRFPVPLPKVGEGPVYIKERYNLKTTLVITVLLLVIITFVIESDLYLVPEILKRFRRQGKIGGN